MQAAKRKKKVVPKKKPKTTPLELIAKDEEEIKKLEAKLNKLEMETFTLEEKNDVLATECALIEQEMISVTTISTEMSLDDNRIIDALVHELQWMYEKQDRLRLLKYAMQHRMFHYGKFVFFFFLSSLLYLIINIYNY